MHDPKAPDNEEQSAVLAKKCLLAAGTSDTLAETVVQLIMATKHHNVNVGADARLMVDIDLSILGRNEARFFEFERQNRKEYAWVPETVFALKRAAILEGFLSRDPIYVTEWFRDKYERQARNNLAASIGCLRQKSR